MIINRIEVEILKSDRFMICERINMIKEGTNPYYEAELETGYGVIGDHRDKGN